MSDDDRRSARRARLSGVRVTYEGASGEEQSADVTDLSREGLFIESARPLAVGKRISLEIMATGESAPWSALGRVVWIRETGDGDESPAGMAVKIIDAEDTVHAAIERLIETRERTEPGLGDGGWDFEKPPAERPKVLDIPARERTVLGVGTGQAVAPAPVLRAAPVREATLVGVGSSETEDDDREPSLAIDLVDAREPSLAIDLVQKPPSGRAPAPAAAEPPSPASDPPPPESPRPRAPAREDLQAAASVPPEPRRRSGGWLVVLVLLAACGGAAFAFRVQLVPVVHRAAETIARLLR
jgi:type IV pilus assembly protein PilZ